MSKNILIQKSIKTGKIFSYGKECIYRWNRKTFEWQIIKEERFFVIFGLEVRYKQLSRKESQESERKDIGFMKREMLIK